MLRGFVVVLLAANVGFWAWSQGWLDAVVGIPARGDREPGRLARQVDPALVRVTPLAAQAGGAARRGPPVASPPVAPASSAPDSSSTADPPVAAPPLAEAGAPETASTAGASAASPEPAAASVSSAAVSPDCLEAGPFTPAELVAAETVLVRAALPPGSYKDVATDKPGTWIVYMGRYPDAAQLAEKESQIRRMSGVSYERLRGVPQLEPGLSLGRFSDRPSAEAALAELNDRGVRSARVVTVAPASTTHRLRAERPDAALKARLLALKSPALGKGFARCAPNDGAGSAVER